MPDLTYLAWPFFDDRHRHFASGGATEVQKAIVARDTLKARETARQRAAE